MTVLVCDDGAGFRLMLGGHLSDAGHTVSFAATWDETIAFAGEQQPDAILVDPWMTGYEPGLLRRLVACSPSSAVVVAGVQAPDESRRSVTGIDGIAAVVSKREGPGAIVAAVNQALPVR